MLNPYIRKSFEEIKQTRNLSNSTSPIHCGEAIFQTPTTDFSEEFFYRPPDIEINRCMVNISDRKFRNRLKSSFYQRLKLAAARNILDCLPAFHIVSSGKFDNWTLQNIIIEKLKLVEELIISTWTVNFNTVNDILNLFDKRIIKQFIFMTGLYFKKRNPDVYSHLVAGASKRNQTVICCDTHAKISIFKTKSESYVLESSANMTANPRIEQFVLSNDSQLADFHRNWIVNL